MGRGLDLKREVGWLHPLSRASVTVLARREDNDDVLVEAPGLAKPYAVVHLTWTGSREFHPAWPRTTIFDSLKHWEEERMLVDHRDHVVP